MMMMNEDVDGCVRSLLELWIANDERADV